MVPDRECGACTVCCVALPIDSEEIQKAPGIACRHCQSGGGCGVYETRPNVCRIYHCGWRQMRELDETWRPDLSDVLIELHNDAIPAAYTRRPAVRLYVLSDPQIVLKRGFVSLVVRLVANNIPTSLSVMGPRGCYPAVTFLNDLTRVASYAGDERGVARAMGEMMAALAGYEYSPAVFKHSGNRTDLPEG